MNEIRILPEKVASQIAAGEVIDRPASVVRELLDNSIDAGSDRIVVKIEEGGKRLIRVSDNGVGMSRDDILLSIERHATSKISSISDLTTIETLGFRGEALPSISAVSKMEITSRIVDQMVGYRLKVAGHQLRSIDETGAPVGTTIEVRDLFYNTPARRKFLRGVKTETDHIVDALSRIVLPFKHIQLRLDSAGKTILNLPASEDKLNRLSALIGRDVTVSLVEAAEEMDELKLTAFLAPPDLSRTKGDRIFIYVNNRNIRDRFITRAVMEGYGQRLMRGRYPQVVIFMEIAPSLVDINVHPTKQEVRFHNSRLIYEALVSTIESSLRGRFHSVLDLGDLKTNDTKKEHAPGVFIAEPVRQYSEIEQRGTIRHKIELKEEPLLKETPQIIGQLKNTYIMCQIMDGLLMIDQHAAHERIVYETLKKSYRSSQIESQSFLIPHKMELSLKDGRIILKRLDQLSRLGLEVEHFGGSTFLLRSVPAILINTQWEKFLLDLVPVLEDEADLSSDKALDRLLTVMACHGAIRAGQRMSPEEMIQLLKQLEDLDVPTHCPHGRPISKKFTYYEIEKMFKRTI